MERVTPAPDEVWRTFIAIDVPAELHPLIARLQEKLRRTGVRVSCPKPEHSHVTMVFLGDTFVARIPEIVRVIEAAAEGVRPFPCRLAGVGTFGPPRAPRVVWLGVEPSEPLASLREEIAKGVASLGFPLESRPFHPHVTLARIRSTQNAAALTSWVGSVVYDSPGEFMVERVCFYRSQPDRPEAIYTLLHAAKLKGV